MCYARRVGDLRLLACCPASPRIAVCRKNVGCGTEVELDLPRPAKELMYVQRGWDIQSLRQYHCLASE